MPTARQTIAAAFAELMRSDSPAIQARAAVAKRLWETSARSEMTPAHLLALANALVDTVDALPGPVQDSASLRIAWMGERPSIPAKPGEVVPNYSKVFRDLKAAGFYVGQADETDAYLEEGQALYDSAPDEQTWAEWAQSKVEYLVSPVTTRVNAAVQYAKETAEEAKDKAEEIYEGAKDKAEDAAQAAADALKALKNAAIAIGVTGVLVLAISASAGRGSRR